MTRPRGGPAARRFLVTRADILVDLKQVAKPARSTARAAQDPKSATALVVRDRAQRQAIPPVAATVDQSKTNDPLAHVRLAISQAYSRRGVSRALGSSIRSPRRMDPRTATRRGSSLPAEALREASASSACSIRSCPYSAARYWNGYARWSSTAPARFSRSCRPQAGATSFARRAWRTRARDWTVVSFAE